MLIIVILIMALLTRSPLTLRETQLPRRMSSTCAPFLTGGWFGLISWFVFFLHLSNNDNNAEKKKRQSKKKKTDEEKHSEKADLKDLKAVRLISSWERTSIGSKIYN